jgi:hypothetical protein
LFFVFAATAAIVREGIIILPSSSHHLIIGCANSLTFKTASTHIAQPVIAGTQQVRRIVQLYVENVRPFVAPDGENKKTAMLFLGSDGKPDLKLERRLRSFFKSELNLNLTTTTVRKIFDTTASDLHLRGLISAAELDAVHFVNGHTNTTSKDFYLQ